MLTPNMLNAAHLAADHGIPVFPVEPMGKRPLLQRWQEVAATTVIDSSAIDLIWQRWPSANLGYATGHAFDVLDLDGALGLDTFKRQVPKDGYRHKGPIVQTGGGGLHLYFAPTDLTVRSRNDLGIDWRGFGGFVVGPPSLHQTGNRYLWRIGFDLDLPEPPEWLMDFLHGIYAPRRQAVVASTAPVTARPDICASAPAHTDHGAKFCKARCPFHDNSNEPSLVLWRDTNRFQCMSGRCRVWGDSLDLLHGRYAGQN